MSSFPGFLRRLAPVALLLGLLVSLLGGCASVPESGGGAGATAAKFSPSPPKPGFGAVYVGRPMGWRTTVFQVPIEVDGRPLASVGPNEYARTELPAGRHSVGVPESYWTTVINGIPHPVEITVESGKSYYLLPTEWAGREHTSIVMVGTVVVPTRTAESHSSFSVQTIAPAGEPPAAFAGLTAAAPASP
jgi:hypothetical protein